MCQLLGMNCNNPTDIVFSFCGLLPRSGKTDHHGDGWGIAFFEGAGVRHFVDRDPAMSSPLADFVKSWPIKSQNVIAHIRKATQGEVTLENCHPFVRELWGRYWVFAHNGCLKDFQPVFDGPYRPVGTTDSERAFCLLLQNLRREFADTRPAPAVLSAFLRAQCAQLAQFGAFNMMLSDGQSLYVHCSTNLHYIVRRHPFSRAQLADEDLQIDFAAVTQESDQVAVIATTPLTRDEIWCQMSPGQFLQFVDGAPVMLPAADSNFPGETHV
ncbi:class II glutamine amidotransferase [Massilia sp. W12]|uniref:class II glutamine amidotransferase n=1 Tax=Massilia sp. W12 TaxID=3126507 RepID=UPI0030CD3653